MDNDKLDSLNEEYTTFLQSLDTKTKAIVLSLLTYIHDNKLAEGNFTFAKQSQINKAISDFKKSYNSLLTDGTTTAIRYAKDIKKAELSPSLSDAVDRLSQKNLGVVELSAILHTLEYSQISPVFNGSRDIDIVNKIYYKSWSDGLNVGDRVNRITNNIERNVTQTIKQGVIANQDPKEIERHVVERFTGSNEQKAMLRLATHTINMVHKLTGATIVNDASMVKGVRIMRSPAGSVKCQICVEHAGEVGGSGIVYLKESGDNLGVMADMPPYHSRCLCFEEVIFEDVERFVQNARKEFASVNNKDYTVNNGTLDKVEARKWYLQQEAKIPEMINSNLSFKQQARQAFELRNQFRIQARELMQDRQLAEKLKLEEPNLTWDQVIQKAYDKGYTGDDVYKYIIQSSQRTRPSVNKSLGLE